MTDINLEGRINVYACDHCGMATYTIHVHNGTTPYLLACRASGRFGDCPGMSVLAGYPTGVIPTEIITQVLFEWYRPEPDEYKKLNAANRAYVDNGGLLIRDISMAGRSAFINHYAPAR